MENTETTPTVKPIIRVLDFKGEILPDTPGLPLQNVLAMQSMTRPELVNAIASYQADKSEENETSIIEYYNVLLIEGTKG